MFCMQIIHRASHGVSGLMGYSHNYMIMKKYPQEDSISALANHEIKFTVLFNRIISHHVNIQVDSTGRGKSPFHGHSFSYEERFEPGKHSVEISIIEMDDAEDDWDIDGSPSFHWDVRVYSTEHLYKIDFREAKNLIKEIVTWVSAGHYGKIVIEKITEYYQSLPADKQDELLEQTELSDYIGEDETI